MYRYSDSTENKHQSAFPEIQTEIMVEIVVVHEIVFVTYLSILALKQIAVKYSEQMM